MASLPNPTLHSGEAYQKHGRESTPLEHGGGLPSSSTTHFMLSRPRYRRSYLYVGTGCQTKNGGYPVRRRHRFDNALVSLVSRDDLIEHLRSVVGTFIACLGGTWRIRLVQPCQTGSQRLGCLVGRQLHQEARRRPGSPPVDELTPAIGQKRRIDRLAEVVETVDKHCHPRSDPCGQELLKQDTLLCRVIGPTTEVVDLDRPAVHLAEQPLEVRGDRLIIRHSIAVGRGATEQEYCVRRGVRWPGALRYRAPKTVGRDVEILPSKWPLFELRERFVHERPPPRLCEHCVDLVLGHPRIERGQGAAVLPGDQVPAVWLGPRQQGVPYREGTQQYKVQHSEQHYGIRSDDRGNGVASQEALETCRPVPHPALPTPSSFGTVASPSERRSSPARSCARCSSHSSRWIMLPCCTTTPITKSTMPRITSRTLSSAM